MTPISQSKVSFKETTFFGLLRINGVKIIFNWSFFWSFIVSIIPVCYSIGKGRFLSDFTQLSKALSSTLLGASAGVLGIVIAALTITLTLFHNSLLPKMLEIKLIHKFLFPYWFVVSLWGAGIVFCIFLNFLDTYGFKRGISIVFAFELFLFLYATFYTVQLTGLVIRLALQRSQMS